MLAKEASKNNLDFMRRVLFAIAETMAYISIFPDIFPEHFIEEHADIANIGCIIDILKSFESINVFIDNISELEIVMELIEINY